MAATTASLSLRGASDPAAFVTDFGGATRLVVDYLMGVVLEQQSDELRTFLGPGGSVRVAL